MPNMPDKPETWAMVLAWLSQHAPVLYATGLSFLMAAVRIIYGGGTQRQALLEGALCGGLTLTLISGLEFFGLPQSLSTFVGGWVGFLGVEKVRALADRYANFKIPISKAGE
jgi:lambda family phage holin